MNGQEEDQNDEQARATVASLVSMVSDLEFDMPQPLDEAFADEIRALCDELLQQVEKRLQIEIPVPVAPSETDVPSLPEPAPQPDAIPSDLPLVPEFQTSADAPDLEDTVRPKLQNSVSSIIEYIATCTDVPLNCSRFGRVRKKRRLSPPDTPVKKLKVNAGKPASFAKKLKLDKPAPACKPCNANKPAGADSAKPVKAVKAAPPASKPRKLVTKPIKLKVKVPKPSAKPAEVDVPTPECKEATVEEPERVTEVPEPKDIKNKWFPGDVVWFKAAKKPYWPAKVACDPALGDFKRNRSGMNEYYVTPFGPDSSGKWVLSPMVLKFDGLQHFQEHARSIMDKHVEDGPIRSSVLSRFQIREPILEEWTKVVLEVENCHLNGALGVIKAKSPSSTPKSAACKSPKKRKPETDPPGTPKKRSQKNKIPNGEPILPAQQDAPKKKRRRKKDAAEPEAAICVEKKEPTLSNSQPCTAPKKSKKHLSKSLPVVLQEKTLNGTSELNESSSSIEQTIQEVIQDSLLSTKSVAVPKAKKRRIHSKSSKKSPVKVISKTSKPTEAKILPKKKKTKKKSVLKAELPKAECKKKSKASPLKKCLNEAGPHSGDSDLGNSVKKDCLSAEGRTEKVCQSCERPIPISEVVRCVGRCLSVFHASCIKPADPPVANGAYMCEECSSGSHSCFVCKRSDGDEIRRCSIRLCGKFYHSACLEPFRSTRRDGNNFICSLHMCLTCALNHGICVASRQQGIKGRICRCLRCPVAYHTTEECLAAGSVIVSNSSIICPKHHKPKKLSKAMHINVNWCFVCSTGGSLICCESCPASFHAECLGIVPPEGSYYCAECVAGYQPKYGNIVWVKLGNYRWWPAKILNPKNVPGNIRNMVHQLGEFPVQFFGTHDYHWTNRSRVFQFLEGDQSAHDNAANRLAKLYEKALNEACVAYHEWKIANESRAAQDFERSSLRPPQYKYIKASRPVGRVAMTMPDPSQMTPCDCDPNSENPCGSDSECLNRMLMFECHPAVCAAGEKCQNQRFEKRQYMPAEIFRAEGKGWGLKSLVDIKKGEFVNEYIGEIIDEEECRLRMKKMHEENNTNYYFLTVDKDRIIDAGRKGNLSRFMNHSCQPNCETHKWTVNGNTRVGLFAVCDIPKGTELTFNYNLDCLGNNKTTCRCEAPNCSGFIGERPKSTKKSKESLKENDKAGHLKKRKRKPKVARCEHDDECFRCGHDGTLLMCDRKNCPKTYHLSCLNLDKPPHGRWECPWHHCDICGKFASSLCSVCPNSFCKEHSAGNIHSLSETISYCVDHVKEEEAIQLSIEKVVHNSIDVDEARTAQQPLPKVPKVEPTVINLKKKRCQPLKVAPVKTSAPKKGIADKRKRMIAEKLKIKLNGSTKNGYPTCKRIRGKNRLRKKPGAFKSSNQDGPSVVVNGTAKKERDADDKSAKKKLFAKINGKTIKILSKKNVAKVLGCDDAPQPQQDGNPALDLPNGTSERTENVVTETEPEPSPVADCSEVPELSSPLSIFDF